MIAVFAAIYVVVAARLVQYGLAEPVATAWINTGANAVASRPDIVDRNGMLLATDLNMVSLYADPRRVVDPDEVVEKLASVIPISTGVKRIAGCARTPASSGCDAS